LDGRRVGVAKTRGAKFGVANWARRAARRRKNAVKKSRLRRSFSPRARSENGGEKKRSDNSRILARVAKWDRRTGKTGVFGVTFATLDCASR
jgi:hypothetical protein